MNRRGEAFYDDDALTGDAVFEQAQIAVMVADRASRLRYINPFARDLFGLPEGGDPRDVTLMDLGLQEADLERANQLSRRALQGDTWDGTFAIMRADSSWLHVRVNAVPMRDPSGAVDGFAVFASEALRSGRVEDLYGLLERVGSRLAGSLEFDSTIKAVAEILVPQFADHCFIDLFDHDRLIRRISVHAEGWTPPP